jgi:hydroxymethylglutaryl-CoA reductase (NADPH)
MDMKRWPRKNDPSRSAAQTGTPGLTAALHASTFRRSDAQEMLTGGRDPRSPSVGRSSRARRVESTSLSGCVRETGRASDRVYVPLAHTEGSLSASLYRGARAVSESGGFKTFVLGDRITRGLVLRLRLGRGGRDPLAFPRRPRRRMRRWLAERVEGEPALSKHAKLREVETHVVGPMCHVMWAFTTGDACGPNMMTRNAYALNMGYVMEQAPVKPERAILEANMGGDKKPSHRYFERGGHGKTVIAEATLTETRAARAAHDVDDLLELSWAGTHGAVASGMQSVAFTPASAIAAIFAATGQDLGMVGTSSMAHGTGRASTAACTARSGCPGSRSAPSAAGRPPLRASWLELIGCAGAGKVYRFAQIVAAATLALEISASAAMATAGSHEFFKAHNERGGLR